VRRESARWRAAADRLPPADLLDQILLESAYDYELRGPRRAQARENVKKLRALVRRVQNRGYATLPRLAAHLDSLSAGDESNAALEAVDAVNLMTVHAAKGLEFPIVFVVNLTKGAGGPASVVRLLPARGPDGAEVVLPVPGRDRTAEAEERLAEREETKRLLYVALTRARDRLYLAFVAPRGAMEPGRGSLAEVVPAGLREAIARAAGQSPPELLEWNAAAGRRHVFRVCRAEVPADSLDKRPPANASRERPPEAFGEIVVDSSPRRASATALAARDAPELEVAAVDEALVDGGSEEADERVSGSLVHRLFQAGAPPDEPVELAALARTLLRADERSALEDEAATVARAVEAYGRLARRPDVQELLASGERAHEVPISFLAAPDLIVRGSIDLLVRRPDGSMIAVEFKTGAPRPAHRRQLELYVRAVAGLSAGAQVEGRLIYA
ncbi:MAG TPA: 3'-5' exonuclease, partial [Vicinamibacterales bacterium]|nr:3'-5' exonuclease [Vicinamibacterales bacterium]